MDWSAARETPWSWRGRPDVPVARRTQTAAVLLIGVLLLVSGFAIWSSQAGDRATTRALAASTLSDAYASAATAVALEESLERKYRLEPSAEVRARFDAASANLDAALARVVSLGGAEDRRRAGSVAAIHGRFLDAIGQMFAAVDAGDTARVLEIDTNEVDPPSEAMVTAVQEAAATQHQESLAALAHLEAVEDFAAWTTPVVFVVALVCAGLMAASARHSWRLLEAERSRAVHSALHDDLTLLPNRLLLATRVDEVLAANRRSRALAALMLIDLDRFKEVNDTFGHAFGDDLLVQAAARIADVMSAWQHADIEPAGAPAQPPTVARLAGDEFAVLLPRVAGLDAVRSVVADVRAALDEPFDVDGVAVDVEATVGVVLAPEHGDDASTLIKRADVAMYLARARHAGAFLYDPALDEHSPARLAVHGQLRRAIELDQLALVFQPKTDIRDGAVVGAEALVRWNHPVRGLVMPADFIPAAENSGLIGPLTTRVLTLALVQARIWMDDGHPLAVSVNLSARNLLDEHLPDLVSELLTTHRVPAALLELEVTESAIMTDPARAQRVLSALSARGVRLSLDDFGAGYTSLGQLRSLPVSELKIDRSFVSTMVDEVSVALIVRSIIDLGHSLGLTVVAEGIETSEQLVALSALGCDVAQGYSVSRPLDVATFDRWYAERRAAV